MSADIFSLDSLVLYGNIGYLAALALVLLIWEPKRKL
jgi:hypothetical protein